MKLIVVRGRPGSGKTTLGKKLALENGCQLYETDQYLSHLAGRGWSGNYTQKDLRIANMLDAAGKLKMAHLQDAINYVQGGVNSALGRGKSVVVTGQFNDASKLDWYKTAAERYGAEFKVVDATQGNGKSVHFEK